MTLFRTFIAAAVTLFATGLLAQEGTSLQSDWLELVKGHKEGMLGVELMEIEPEGTDGATKITLAVPKTSVSDPDSIEEIMVYGRKPEEPEPLDIRYEWLDDYDNDRYGLVIHLGPDSKWPIRLFMNSSPGFIRQDYPK